MIIKAVKNVLFAAILPKQAWQLWQTWRTYDVQIKIVRKNESKDGDYITIELHPLRIKDKATKTGGAFQFRHPSVPDRLREDLYPNRSN